MTNWIKMWISFAMVHICCILTFITKWEYLVIPQYIALALQIYYLVKWWKENKK